MVKYISIIFVVILAGLALSWLFSRQNSLSTNRIEIKNSQNQSVSVKNPYDQALKLDKNKDALLRQTNSYEIVYFAQNQSFLITLKAKPLQATRDKAEQDFLDTLGISKQEACKLYVQLEVIGSADLNLAGKDYSLNFCPQGKPFPS